MNLRKLGLMSLLALAALAFAVPTMASAKDPVFTHEGIPITSEQTIEVSFTGPMGFNFLAPSVGIHCEQVHMLADLEAEGTGRVTDFKGTGCTTTHPDPTKANMPTDTTPIGLHAGGETWKIHTVTGKDKLKITHVHINNKVTHPLTPHLVIGESTLTGDMTAIFPASGTEDLTTLELDDEGATLEIEGSKGEANVSGHLERSTNTTVGVEE